MIKNIKKIIGFLFCFIFCTTIAIAMPQMAKAEETDTFTDASGKSGDLNWNITADGTLTVTGNGDYELINIEFSNGTSLKAPEWLRYCEYIHMAEINVQNITSTENMFYYCKNLANLDLTNFDTKNVTNMSFMFYYCESLTNLDLSNFDTNSVTDMSFMFTYCESLTNLDLNNFNTNNVTNMSYMFFACYDLSTVDLSNFDTSNVTDMRSIFGGCYSLKTLDLSNFNTSNVTNMSHMFYYCQNLSTVDLSNFNTSNVTDMSRMFYCCYGLKTPDLSSFNTSNVTNMNSMFHCCYGLKTLDLSNFNTSNVTNMNSMFFDCYMLKTLDLSNFDISNVENSQFSLSDLSALEKLYFFANAPLEYVLPTSAVGNYIWMNEYNETCTKTAKLDRKMTYTRVDKNYVPTSTPSAPPIITPVPSALPSVAPSSSPVVQSVAHIFSDYNYKNPVTGSAVIIYGNGKTQTIDGKKVNNKICTVYTDVLASYKYTPNSNGTVKASAGKVIVGITKSDTKPEVNSKNKITDKSASKIAKAKIKNGQITVTAVGKEGGLVYLWVIDTGNKGVSACCPIDVKLAPTKLEIQNTSGNKIEKNAKLANGSTLDVCVAGLVGSTKTDDGTYTAEVASKYQSYVSVTPVEGSKTKFKINAKGLKNNKDTKVTVTFKCDQNGKKANLSLTITK